MLLLFGIGKEWDWIKTTKRLNQTRYKSSSNFMKCYQATNVSLPISINRTFVTDSYDKDIMDDIKNVLDMSVGGETSMANFINQGGRMDDDADRMRIMDNQGWSGELLERMKAVGGVYQDAPLGYIYDAAAWTNMINDEYKRKPGTISVIFPNGMEIPELLVQSLAVNFSATQVKTVNGLRPLTATISLILIPSRVWGIRDIKRLLACVPVTIKDGSKSTTVNESKTIDSTNGTKPK